MKVGMQMINALKKAVIRNKGIIPYINLDDNNAYRGWVSDFHLCFNDGDQMRLNLKDENELFLLFVLASAWSRSGPWENAAFFVTYLKHEGYDKMALWCDDNFVERRKAESAIEAKKVFEYCSGIDARKKVSFRKDNYDSIAIIARYWDEIKQNLDKANNENDYMIFIKYMRNLKGLGTGGKKMNIKILLILRELRCQNIYDNIPGELCCVPDERVKDACIDLGIKLPQSVVSIKSLVMASTVLYQQFGDLYDIPPFAYGDVKDQITN